MIGLIGKKIGMTQIHKTNGELQPATALEVGPCPVLQVKTADGKDGYTALKLGFGESNKIAKPQKGICKKAGVALTDIFHEFRINEAGEAKAGDVLKVDVFEVGEKVNVRGRTKGRGFAGVIKRHKFHGGDDAHGCRAKRIPGSIGASSDPSRVFKGKKMPGHYGNVFDTVEGLEILLVDAERNILFVKGAVPGKRNGIVFVSKQK